MTVLSKNDERAEENEITIDDKIEKTIKKVENRKTAQ